VIVSLGVVGTPRFLQANGIGPAAVLNSIGARVRAVNNAVGANLTAHQGFLMAYKTNTTMLHDSTYWSNNIADFFFKTDGSASTLPADMQVSVLEGVYGENVAYEDGTPGRDLIFTIRHLIDTGDFGTLVSGAWQKYIGLVVFNVDPVAVGSINATSVNVDRNPTMDYGWSEAALQTNGDLHKLRGAIAKMRQIFLNSPGFTDKYNISEIVPGNLYSREVAATYTELSGDALKAKEDEMFIRYSLSHFYHITGTCRLGECTDLDGRVKGVKRLRVCDNSLLPQPDGNPSGTLYTVCTEIGRRILSGAVSTNTIEFGPQYNYF
jgi:choline dehydrogenase-like flavoprotein